MNKVYLINLVVVLIVLAEWLIWGIINKKKPISKRNEPDERQKIILGSILVHTLFFGVILMVISGILGLTIAEFKISLAEQNLAIIYACFVYFSIETFLRMDNFGRKRQARGFLWFVFAGFFVNVALLSLEFYRLFVSGEFFLREGSLTQVGWETLTFSWGSLTFGLIILGYFKELRKG